MGEPLLMCEHLVGPRYYQQVTWRSSCRLWIVFMSLCRLWIVFMPDDSEYESSMSDQLNLLVSESEAKKNVPGYRCRSSGWKPDGLLAWATCCHAAGLWPYGGHSDLRSTPVSLPKRVRVGTIVVHVAVVVLYVIAPSLNATERFASSRRKGGSSSWNFPDAARGGILSGPPCGNPSGKSSWFSDRLVYLWP